jgi:hypothetical protein
LGEGRTRFGNTGTALGYQMPRRCQSNRLRDEVQSACHARVASARRLTRPTAEAEISPSVNPSPQLHGRETGQARRKTLPRVTCHTFSPRRCKWNVEAQCLPATPPMNQPRMPVCPISPPYMIRSTFVPWKRPLCQGGGRPQNLPDQPGLRHTLVERRTTRRKS